jgi:predicted secreted protein
MSITSAIVFYAVIWALVFYMVNPLWQTSQSEAGEIVPGTPASAPVDAMVRKKALWTTAIATVVFAILYVVIVWQVVTIEDLSWAEPPSAKE